MIGEEVAGLAAGLLEQPDLLDPHRAVGRLAHVVDREQTTAAAVSASISTPVRASVSATTSMSTADASATNENSTVTRVNGNGWHNGMRSAVRLAA
jgi:hypothetical protein